MKLLVVISALLSIACSAPKSFYDFETDSTIYKVFPVGSIGLAGIWRKSVRFRDSGQQHYVKEDTLVSVTIAVKDDYPYYYYRDGTEFGFIKAYFEDESLFQMKRRPFEAKILYMDSSQSMIIWKLDDPKIDYAICFKRKGVAVYSVIVYGGWSDDTKVEFLKRIRFN